MQFNWSRLPDVYPTVMHATRPFLLEVIEAGGGDLWETFCSILLCVHCMFTYAHLQLHDPQAICYGIWQVRPRVPRLPHEPGGAAGRTSLPHGHQGQWAGLISSTFTLNLTWNQDQRVSSRSTHILCSRSRDRHGYLFCPALDVGTDVISRCIIIF